MAVQLTDGTNNNVVDATSKGILVQNPKNVNQAGFVLNAYQQDAGAVTGSVFNSIPGVSPDSRLSVGMDTMLFYDVFDYTAQNTNNWKVTTSTMTQTFGSGFTTLNGGSSTATSTYAVMQTYRSFPLFRAGSLHFECRALLTATPQVNNLVIIGLSAAIGTTAAPTDGAYFQYDATGVLRAIINFNGTISQSAALTAPASNVIHEYEIFQADDSVQFWIDGVLYANLAIPSAAGVSTLSSNAYAFVQIANGASAPATAQTIKVAEIMLFHIDENTVKPYPHQQAGMGLAGYVGANGGTMGTTALFANSANPTAAVPSNTSAALGTGFGGNFWSTNTLAVNTDGIISSYQNPVGSTTQPPRMLIITGVRIDSIVQTALTGGPEVFAWSLAFGHTSTSLNTTESATAKAPRRIGLGHQSFGTAAPVGAQAQAITMNFQTPIVVNPGEYIATVMKNIGTVGTAGTIAHMITFDAYWE